MGILLRSCSCIDNHLVQNHVQPASSTASGTASTPSASVTCAATRFQLSDPPYEDYFISDCNSAAQVVITSPLPGSNLTRIGPRLLVCSVPEQELQKKGFVD